MCHITDEFFEEITKYEKLSERHQKFKSDLDRASKALEKTKKEDTRPSGYEAQIFREQLNKSTLETIKRAEAILQKVS